MGAVPENHTFLVLTQGWQRWQSSCHLILLVSSFLNNLGILAGTNDNILIMPSESFSLYHWAIHAYVSPSD